MFWRWNEEPKDQNYVWQYHSKIIPRSLKEKRSTSREIVTMERPTRVTESSNSCFLRYITSVFNNPALWDFSVDTFGLSRITHAGRFTHSRRKKWVFTNSRMKFLLFTHHAWMSFHEFTQQKKGFHDFTQRKKAFHAITQPYGGGFMNVCVFVLTMYKSRGMKK